MPRGRKGRSPDQIRKERAEIARLYLQRMTQAEIGERLGLSRQQVGYELKAIRREWLESSVMDFNTRKAEELARIDHVEREFLTAWERSKAARETTTTEQTTGGEGDRVKAAIRKEQQVGDPRFLAGVQSCIEQRCKILGLNAATETRLTGKDGGPVVFSLEAVIAVEREEADRELEEWQRDRLHRNGSLPLPPGGSQVS
jgi:hypothetical protein